MPDPYGITQVDIPGIYGAVQNARSNRIQQMLGERQIQAADRQAERDNNYNTALTRLFSPPSPPAASSGASGASAAPAATLPINPVVAAYGGVPPGAGQPAITHPGLPGADPAGTPAPPAAPTAPQQIDINSLAAQALIRADPQRGMQALHAISQMSADALEQAHGRLAAMAPYYANAAQIPYGTDGSQRRAYIQSILPQLQQLGLDPAQISGFDPTDASLNQHMRQGMNMDQVLASQRRHLSSVNGQLVDEDALPAGTAQNPVVFTDPILNTGAGPFRRADVLGGAGGQQPPQPGEVRQTSRGPMRFRGGDYRNPANYEPVTNAGGAPPPQAAGTFPRQDGGAFDFTANPPPGR